MSTKIEWTEATWNPVTGCTKISDGCKNCYAEKMHKRLKGMGQKKYQHDFNEVRCHPEALGKIPRGKMVFVCSMSDLFHEDVPFQFICDVLSQCTARKTQIFQILTKRADRMLEFFEWHKILQPSNHWEYDENIWWGVSIENQEQANKRIPYLLQCPVSTRIVSVEPMLGAVDLRSGELRWCDRTESAHECDYAIDRLDWVICGCESGQNRRYTDINWIMDLKDQCVNNSVPFFLKQMDVDGKVVRIPTLDGKVWSQYPGDLK